MAKLWNNIYDLTFNANVTYLIFILIGFVVLTFLPFLVTLIFAFSKGKLSKTSYVYLYSFICGFFITMATFGFLKEALEISSVHSVNYANGNKWITYAWNIFIVVSGLTLGLLFAWGIRSLIRHSAKRKIFKDKTASVFVHTHDLSHDHHDEHHHSEIAPSHLEHIHNDEHDESNPIYKMVAILLLLVHRIPESFLIGYIISTIGANTSHVITSVAIAFIISAVLHLIPEQLVFYYRLREMGKSRSKSLIFSSASLLIFLPFMFLGTYTGVYIYEFWQLRGIIQSFVGGIFIFTSIVEFLPEFYHAHHDKKVFKWTIVLFFIGIIICAFILSFHQHGIGV